MAIYSTFFLSNPDDLLRGFLGWKLPLSQPVRREIRNPFNGERMFVFVREPEWHGDEADEQTERDYQIVPMQGDYHDYLENRLPELVRNGPHWASKGLTNIELDALGQTLGCDEALESAIYSPPSSGDEVMLIPSEMLTRLIMMEQKGLEEIATQWAATMSTPDYTHSISGERLSDGWKPEEAMAIIEPLVALAQKAKGGQKLYLLIEV